MPPRNVFFRYLEARSHFQPYFKRLKGGNTRCVPLEEAVALPSPVRFNNPVQESEVYEDGRSQRNDIFLTIVERT
jgi:hypothetical protein